MPAPKRDKRPSRIATLRRRYEPILQGSDTAKAAGLALAMIANNVIALVSTVVFARLLTDYSSLAALISYFLILSVVGHGAASCNRTRGRPWAPWRRSNA